MSIFLTGDLHGCDTRRFNTDRMKLINHEFNKAEDYIIVLGDFGVIWSTNRFDKSEQWYTRWLSEKPWITLFVDGNHENFERINGLPEVEMFGGKVGKYTDSIYHLKRGELYSIQGKKFFVMGGGVSIDKENRRNRISWWEEEMPNSAEYSHAIDTLEKCNYEIDYVLTHTAPDNIRIQILGKVGMLRIAVEDQYGNITYQPLKDRDQLSMFLEIILREKGLKFKKWYFGHYHTEIDMGEFQSLYESIVEVK